MRNIEKERTIKIYSLLIAIISLDAFCKFFLPSTIIRIFELLCILNILYLCYRMNFIRRLKALHLPVLLSMLTILSISIIIRGDWNGGIKDLLLKGISSNGLWLHISPFVILALPNRKYFRSILKVFFYASLLAIPLWFLNMNDLIERNLDISYKSESIGVFLPFFAGFLLALPSYFSKRENLLIRIVWVIFLILMLLNARRNVSFTLVLYAVIAYFFYLSSKQKGTIQNKIVVVFISLFSVCFLALNFSSLSSGMFSRMTERAGEDTRSGVHEYFFLDFSHAPIEDWLFGRGMDGTYFQPTRNEETGEITDGRPVIETGYLNLMLKGGIIYVLILLIILIMAIRRCFRQKGDLVMKYIGIFLCTYLLDLYTTSPIMPFSVRSILFWFCISISLNRQSTTSYENKRI